MKIRTVKQAWQNGILFQIQSSDGKYWATQFTMNERKDSEEAHESGTMNFSEAQILMDDLWDCGIRPTEGAGSAGSLKATERHLEDMRTLVFKGAK